VATECIWTLSFDLADTRRLTRDPRGFSTRDRKARKGPGVEALDRSSEGRIGRGNGDNI